MKKSRLLFTTAYLSGLLLLTSCGNSPGASDATVNSSQNPSKASESVASANPSKVGTRSNTPVCLVPEASGIDITDNEVAVIDYSHSNLGYFCVKYTGAVEKVKMRVTGNDGTVYTYDVHPGDYEVFPFSVGNGTYEITLYENISDTNYSTCLYTKVDVQIADELSPFLYPNQYVDFDESSKVVAKGAELAESADSDLDVIVNVYNFIISSIEYDHVKAADPPTGYTTDVDAILAEGSGICIDYASVMAAMLRSQRIPTRLEVGYAKDAYHAWISIYTEETGWLNGIFEITSKEWTLVDPTFGANSTDKALKKFIGDGSNYILQKMY